MTPFDLDDAGSYAPWRAEKLANYPARAEDIMVPMDDREAILGLCARANMAIYVSDREICRKTALAFCRGLGLARLDSPPAAGGDGITEIRIVDENPYIPFSNRPLSWHSDGYYNDKAHRVQSVLLHCRRDGRRGGETALLDPEIAYIRLRDADPAMIEALMRPGALTIPENQEIDRPAVTGPVFSVIKGRLHMRYTARKRNALWRNDAITAKARAFLTELLDGGEPLTIRHRLAPGQGLISNNVLHDRSEFEDHEAPNRRRLLYRARFLDRIAA